MNERTLYVPRSAAFREMTDEALDRWHVDLTERVGEIDRRVILKRENGEDTTGLEGVRYHCNRGLKAIAQVRRQRNGEPPPLTAPKPVHNFETWCQTMKAGLRLTSFYADEHEAISQLFAAIDAEDEDAEQAAWDALDVAHRAVQAAYAAHTPDVAEEAA